MAKAKQYGKAVELVLSTPRPYTQKWFDRMTAEQLELMEELRREYQHGILQGRSMDSMIAAARAIGVKVGGGSFRAWVREPVPPDAK